ncbi:type IVB secretion system protein IcmH/DotU [Sulfitobacter albidus]|uniref:Type IVB secretion system protein IcmH/DotU n=1 Tax=Sulfitobacter albidus TaxID=2829501 RepID=A0A975JGI6_9RHOB|nr:type IVB secretion system protein IcmH/DotU [Sulfitobacter albidus]QUJ78121.1 type IVB secretion system protein IcmH/DotU [Sulfitobacter albidus]
MTPQGGDRRGYPAAPSHPAPAPYPPQNPQGYQQQPPYQPAPPYGQPPAYPGYPPQDPQHGWQPPLDGQFPAAQQPATEEVVPVPRIAFGDALRGSGLDIGVSSNPILAAASDLLVLLGRLRTGMVEMQAIPLRDHVVREVSRVVEKCTEAGVPREDIELARYALAATADDIVQTIPGNDPQYWQQFSMAAELLNDRSAGIGFFARLEQVMGYPSQHADVLELMLVCLMLGFEGKYRSAVPNGPVQLSRLRLEAYRRFRSVSERPSEGLSHKWLPVILGGRRSGGAMPLWMVASVGAAMVVGLFATLSWLLSGDAQAAQNRILSLHQGYGEVSIERSGDTFVEYQAADTGQLERIREKLAPEIEAGSVAVTDAADAIAVRLGDALRFGSGSADLTNDLTALATRIGEVLEAEPGEIVIEGHSDNIPLRGTGRYKTNEALSEARANTVRDLLVPHLSDPGRLSVVGVGPAKPLNTDNTAAARAQNRRVEILLRKEERL